MTKKRRLHPKAGTACSLAERGSQAGVPIDLEPHRSLRDLCSPMSAASPSHSTPVPSNFLRARADQSNGPTPSPCSRGCMGKTHPLLLVDAKFPPRAIDKLVVVWILSFPEVKQAAMLCAWRKKSSVNSLLRNKRYASACDLLPILNRCC